MSNTVKTLQAGDITRKALSILHNNMPFIRSINRDYDSRFARSGAKNGGYLEIRNPNQFTVRSGAIMDTQDVTESVQELVVSTQRGVDINFSSVELTLSLDDFADRILTPACTRLAAEVEKVTIANVYPYVFNLENTTFGTKPVISDVFATRARLNQGLAPNSDRFCMVDSLAANSIMADGKSLFHAASEIERQYSKGLLGEVAGLKFMESELTPVHTQGTYLDSDTGIVDLTSSSAGLISGDATVTITSCTTAGTMTAGQVFTIAGVYAVNLETKDVYPHLQQFTATALATASAGTLAVEVSPTPVLSGAKMNCKVVTSSATAAVLTETAGGSGTNATAYTHSLAYHKDAFTFVSADLEMPNGVDFAARKVIDGISMRVVRNYDIVNDKFPCRIDVLFGSKAIRPEWACRMSS